MSGINHEVLQSVMAENVEPMVLKQLGPNGAHLLVILWRTLRSAYTVIAPETYRGRIQVIIALNNDLIIGSSNPMRFSVLEAALSGLQGEDFILQICHTGEYALWRGSQLVHADLANREAVLYEFASGIEHLHVKSETKRIQNPYVGLGSCFAPQTFSELQEALESYSATHARFSSCRILKGIWEDEERIYLLSRDDLKPEEQMRRSLEQHLRSRLRAPEVRPEQNVDESKPVDIKVTWPLTRRHACIEIKWLGKSVNEAGKVTADYGDARANSGARQLADYLDSDHEFAATHVTRGFLVVFDARRPGLARKGQQRSAPTKRKDIASYRAQEITYDPRYEEVRSDFQRPIRFFLEPA